METGKLPKHLLKELLINTPTNENVIVGPQIGLDAAKIKTKNVNLIIGSDPITFKTDCIGEFCVYINANDIAVSGAIPKYFMATILLPPNINKDIACNIFNQVKDTCAKLNIALIGGHTEITDCVKRPVVSGTMIGEEIYNLIPTKAYEGCDVILINKPAIEGTYLLALNGRDKLLSSGIKKEKIEFALNLLKTQGICVLNAVNAVLNNITNNNKIYYMHDPTEGGIASALEEISSVIGKGITIDKIEFMDETEEFCKIFDLNPLGLICSGSLILVADNGSLITSSLKEKGVYSQIIGKVNSNTPHVKYKNLKCPSFTRDEIARFFEMNP